MELIRDLKVWKLIREEIAKQGKKVGFVPTMGALHSGHSSLIEKSVEENEITVVSIFVNPTQFNNPEDYKKYPATLDADLHRCQHLKVDYVLYPHYEEIYRDNYRYRVSEHQDSQILEGEYRQGHFEGVLTVVLKLFNLVNPQSVYFGEKDFQQLKLIEGMVDAFFLPIKVVACPTIREKSGLALSSRNQRLSEEQKILAAKFNSVLRQKKATDDIVAELSDLGFKVEYVREWAGRRLGAVYVDEVRLIDNVEV